MRCAKCGTESRTGRKFCANCGSALAIACPKCNAENEPFSKFCEDCGSALAIGNGSAATTTPTSPAVRVSEDSGAYSPDGERKTVTALFADIKGSTELMRDLDPEEARRIVDPALKVMIEAVRRYGGYIVQSTGDGIFALFGAPLAHEDHPQRALYAALRMQAVAPVGSIAVSETTRHWCEGYFAFKSLGPTRLRGVSDPIEVHEVTGLGPLRTRLQRAIGRGLTKFVGRERELQAMRHAAELARNGHGQIVAAVGDPGVGKSRLLYEFKATSQTGWKVLETVSISHGKASAYLPVIDLLRNYFDILIEDDERKRREKVAGRIVMLDHALEDSIPYLFALLGVAESGDALAQMDPHLRQRRTIEAIKRVIVRECLNQPVMVMFEDLHWLDAESQLLLNWIVDSLGPARILLLVNYRPEYHHEWATRSYYTQLWLHSLDSASADAMLDALLTSPAPAATAGTDGEGSVADKPVGDRVRIHDDLTSLKQLILTRTEGNPFFIEEMVQELFEDGVLARDGKIRLAKPLSDLKLPSTVQAVLASRIDRLPAAEKELLQTLSVIGRDFSQPLVSRVAGYQAEDLGGMLADLQLAEFIYEQPAISDIEYTFKHAWTQQVAQNSILLERRKQIHEQTAQAIEALFEASLSDHYVDLARHYESGGNVPKAINYLHLAAQQAIGRSAYAEAYVQLTTALKLLRSQVESAERDRTEIGLVRSMAMCTGVGAITADLAVSALERALDLTNRIGDDSNRLELLESLAYHFSILADKLTRSRALHRELLASSERGQDFERVGWARSRLAWLSMHEADFPAAVRELDLTFRMSANPSLPQRMRAVNWRVHGRAFGSLALWIAGYPARATFTGREAFEVARRINAGGGDRIFACWWSGYLNLLLRESNTARAFNEEIATLIEQHGLPLQKIANVPLAGWVLVQLGQIEIGLSQLLGYKAEILEPGDVFATWLFIALGNAYLANRRTSEGIRAMEEGVELCRTSRVRMLESELHRLKGELLLSDGNKEAAAESFHGAIELARHQGAKSWELRAAMSLARLLSKQGYRDKARVMLADIYNWFIEGFDTADLKEAKALLDELSE